MLSRLANTNINSFDPSHSKLDALFTYNSTLVKIHLGLISRILAGYKDDKYWARLHRQVQANNELGGNKVMLLFVTGGSYRSDSDLYISPRPESLTNPSSRAASP